MKALVLTLICATMVACAGDPPVPVAPWVGKFRNACVPEAIAMAEGLHDVKVEARVLILQTPQYSHAVAVYLYPAGANQIWVWDSYWKSTTVRAFWDDPVGIANAWLEKCGRPERASTAHFLDP